MDTATVDIKFKSLPEDYDTRPTSEVLAKEFDAFRKKGSGFLSGYHFFKDSQTCKLLDDRINATARGSVLDKAHVGELAADLNIYRVQQDAIEVAFSTKPVIVKHHHFFSAGFQLRKKMFCVLNTEEDIEILKVQATLDNVPEVDERPKKTMKRGHYATALKGMHLGLKKMAKIKGAITDKNVHKIVDLVRKTKPRWLMTDEDIKTHLLKNEKKMNLQAQGFTEQDKKSLQRIVADSLKNRTFPYEIDKDKPVTFTDKNKTKPKFAISKCDDGGLGSEELKRREKETIFRNADVKGLATRLSQYSADKHKNPDADIFLIVTNNNCIEEENWVKYLLEGDLKALEQFLDYNSNSTVHGEPPYKGILFAPHANASAMELYNMSGETSLKTPEMLLKDIKTYRAAVKKQKLAQSTRQTIH
jgi:hypothetical protein